ncbi:dienelactone hydrolase family protein [Gordonia sp. CPCC 206044]|uniref:dienelactone hydrolase family protein n=1 Tax=Gordonia sp. CPCC 206044 TaxID=3140793 RepID=UPI003AF379D9
MALEVDSGYIEVDRLRAYQSVPRFPAGSAPTQGMLVLPMVTGIGEQVREWADQIAAETECIALAWDTWHGKSSDDTSFGELMDWSANLKDQDVLRELKILLAYLREDLGLERIGVVGWCLGGRYALILGGLESDLANVVAVHPTITTSVAADGVVDAVAESLRTEAPVFVAYPGKDSIVSRESFLALQEALQSRVEAASIIHLYPQAKHGFSDKRRHNEEVNVDAYMSTWPQALEFVKATTSR